jgi:hypothetical protein
MNVEIGTESAQFPEKEHINGIFFVVQWLDECNFYAGIVDQWSYNKPLLLRIIVFFV